MLTWIGLPVFQRRIWRFNLLAGANTSAGGIGYDVMVVIAAAMSTAAARFGPTHGRTVGTASWIGWSGRPRCPALRRCRRSTPIMMVVRCATNCSRGIRRGCCRFGAQPPLDLPMRQHHAVRLWIPSIRSIAQLVVEHLGRSRSADLGFVEVRTNIGALPTALNEYRNVGVLVDGLTYSSTLRRITSRAGRLAKSSDGRSPPAACHAMHPRSPRANRTCR